MPVQNLSSVEENSARLMLMKIADLSDVKGIESLKSSSFMPYKSVFDALENVAKARPHRRALTYLKTVQPSMESHSWSHCEFLSQISRAANLFTSLAGADEPRIAMLLPTIPQAYFTLFGGEAAGVVCPINYLLGVEHIAKLLKAANINILVVLGLNPELDIWVSCGAVARGMPASETCPLGWRALRGTWCIGIR